MYVNYLHHHNHAILCNRHRDRGGGREAEGGRGGRQSQMQE